MCECIKFWNLKLIQQFALYFWTFFCLCHSEEWAEQFPVFLLCAKIWLMEWMSSFFYLQKNTQCKQNIQAYTWTRYLKLVGMPKKSSNDIIFIAETGAVFIKKII
jgi:hypothetical protein